ncbi:MAG: flagellar basal-body rod protein FlgF [Gemmataceae bacterium]|nr:flagellar basal-body rod protein FlgF [Gemmataceae bacterium]
MLRGLYSATSSWESAMRRQETLAENLAHLSVPGFRARGMKFETILSQEVGVPPTRQASQTFADFQPGPIRETGHPLHLAIDGDGFFVLQGPNGPVYTRNGSFHRLADGRIVSDGGYPLLGAGGPIVIPADSQQLTIGRDGAVSVDGAQVDQVRLATFDDPQKLQIAGPTLFSAPAGVNEVPAAGSIIQGALEGSNVNPAWVLVEMIHAQRFFEAVQRSIRTLNDAIQLNTRPE